MAETEIHTDGSHLLHLTEEKAFGYGLVIVHKGRQYIRYGRLKSKCYGSTCAEVYSICNAIHLYIDKGVPDKNITLYTDCQAAINLFENIGSDCKKQKYVNLRKSVNTMNNKLKKNSIKINFKHVKSHRPEKTDRISAMNEFCDALAKLGAKL